MTPFGAFGSDPIWLHLDVGMTRGIVACYGIRVSGLWGWDIAGAQTVPGDHTAIENAGKKNLPLFGGTARRQGFELVRYGGLRF